MRVVDCPTWGAELEVDAADLGFRLECPACHTAFTPHAPPPAEPPSPVARRLPEPADDGKRVVACSECGGQVAVAADDLGHTLRCPLCGRVFRPERPPAVGGTDEPAWRRKDTRSRRRRNVFRDDEDETPDDRIARAKRECEGTGVGLIVIGILAILTGLLRVVLGGAGLGFGGGVVAPGAGGGWWPVFHFGYGLYSAAMGGFLMYVGTRMRQAKQYTLCLIACVIALVPGVGPCFPLPLIFGVIGLTKLNDKRVKDGFAANRPGYDPDAG